MERPIRVAYFDLGFSREQYGLQPTRYGGGGVLARYMKEDLEVDFHVFAPLEAFENVGHGERVDRCHPLPDYVLSDMRALRPIPFSFEVNWNWTPDIVLHGHTCATINLGPTGNRIRPALVHWSGFDGKAGHPHNDYILLYDPSFTPCFGERPKYVRIGKPVPEVWPGYEGREPFVIQCSRHDTHMNSVALAKQCLAEGFKGVFAGPIHPGCQLMDYIDGKITTYLGEIGELEKLSWYRRASLFGLLHEWPEMPFNQSVIEAQGQGTPLYVNGHGLFLSHYLKHGYNGFEAKEQSLWVAYAGADEGMSFRSWKAAREYDVSVMLSTFKQAFREIVAEWGSPPRRH